MEALARIRVLKATTYIYVGYRVHIFCVFCVFCATVAAAVRSENCGAEAVTEWATHGWNDSSKLGYMLRVLQHICEIYV